MNKLILFLCVLLAITLGAIWYVRVQQGYFFTPPQAPSDLVLTQDQEAQDVLTVSFLDIGQGDATFIVFPNGEQMLVDCAIDARILEALGRVMPFYDRDIDYLLVTHPDKDHYGGCPDVLDRFEIGHIIYNGYEKKDSTEWQAFWHFVQSEQAVHTDINKNQTMSIASTTITFLYPDHDLRVSPYVPLEEKKKEPNANNGSIVFLLSYGDIDMLFTGDAEKEVEQYLVDTYGSELDVEVLKVGHHGSNTSSIDPFVAEVTPEHAVISSGKENKYGHPSPRVLKRLERAHSTIWRTDIQGDIILSTDGITTTWKTL